jgi:hypothetical protein
MNAITEEMSFVNWTIVTYTASIARIVLNCLVFMYYKMRLYAVQLIVIRLHEIVILAYVATFCRIKDLLHCLFGY